MFHVPASVAPPINSSGFQFQKCSLTLFKRSNAREQEPTAETAEPLNKRERDYTEKLGWYWPMEDQRYDDQDDQDDQEVHDNQKDHV